MKIHVVRWEEINTTKLNTPLSSHVIPVECNGNRNLFHYVLKKIPDNFFRTSKISGMT